MTALAARMALGPGFAPVAGPPPVLPEEREEERKERPSAWVPPSSHLKPGSLPSRSDVVLFVLSSVGYLLIVVLLDAISNTFAGNVSVGSATLGMVRETLTDLGWFGMLSVGFVLWFLPGVTGIPVRPRVVVQGHLIVANFALLAYFVSALSLGATAGVAEAFLVLASLSYVAIVISILLTLVLVLQDWKAGLL